MRIDTQIYDRYTEISLDDMPGDSAAVELHNALGHEVWQQLQLYREFVAFLGVVTRALDRERRHLNALQQAYPDAAWAVVQEFVPDMADNCRSVIWRDLFWYFHESFEEVLESEAGIALQGGSPMRYLKLVFENQPVFLMMYNLRFSVTRRLTWRQVVRWAVGRLRERPVESPAWPRELKEMPIWDRDEATAIWNRAEMEAVVDIQRRFDYAGLWAHKRRTRYWRRIRRHHLHWASLPRSGPVP